MNEEILKMFRNLQKENEEIFKNHRILEKKLLAANFYIRELEQQVKELQTKRG